jgi:hypothetical protein
MHVHFARWRCVVSAGAFGVLLWMSPRPALATGRLMPSFLQGTEEHPAHFGFFDMDSTATLAGSVADYPSYELQYPVTWKNGVFTRLALPPEVFASVKALNDDGDMLLQLQDYSGPGASIQRVELRRDDGDTVDLKAEYGFFAALALNDGESIVGYKQISGNDHLQVVIGDTIHETGIIDGFVAFNDADQLLATKGSDPNVTSILWQESGSQTIGDVGFHATGLNNAGHVIGYTLVDPTTQQWSLWDGKKMRVVGTGIVQAALNDLDQVVGADKTGLAFLWESGKTRDLSALLDPAAGVTFVPSAINRAGLIYGGCRPIDGSAGRPCAIDLHGCVDVDHDGKNDDDDDGLCDNWETEGIDYDLDGAVDYVLPEHPDPEHKDVYLELDWMEGHRPLAGAIERVEKAFAGSGVKNPDGQPGVRLHVVVDEQAAPHSNDFEWPGTISGGYLAVKNEYFGTASERSSKNDDIVLAAKALAFRYGLFVHQWKGHSASSGVAELAGNDLLIGLGRYGKIRGHRRGTVDQQAGTLMHELGHTLGLRHGGIDEINCKPNYLSVMNYMRQFDGAYVPRELDYSRAALPTLDESNLIEAIGVLGPEGVLTTHFVPALPKPLGPIPVEASGPVDWNFDGDTNGVGLRLDLIGGCPDSSMDPPGITQLAGHDDWSNLHYSFRDSQAFFDGAALRIPGEFDLDEALAVSPDTDEDGALNLVDNCPADANADQKDQDEDGVGDPCDDCPALFNPSQAPCASLPPGGEPDDGTVVSPVDAGAPNPSIDASTGSTPDAGHQTSGEDAGAGTGPDASASPSPPREGGTTPEGPGRGTSASGCSCSFEQSAEQDPWAMAGTLTLLMTLRRRHRPRLSRRYR